MPKRVLSRTEIIKAHELLKLHLIPAETDGFFKYQEGWDDAKVASELDSAIQATSIGNLRVELFGKLDTTKNVTQAENIRITELETLVRNLTECYSHLELKHNRLVETLALNKVANVMHLKTTAKEDQK